MADTIGNLAVIIRADTSGMVKGIQDAQKSLKSFSRQFGEGLKTVGTAMAAMGGAVVAAGVASVKSYAEMAHEVELLSEKTGFSAKSLSELKYAADMTGTTIEGLAVGIRKMQTVLTDAGTGSKTAQKALENINLTFKDLQGLKPEEQFRKILIGISDIQDPAAKSAAAVDILGRSGTDLLPIIANGEQGLNDFARAAADAGLVLDEASMKAGANAQEAFESMGKAIEGARNALAVALLPTMTTVVNKISEVVKGIQEWVKEHPALSDAIFKLGGVLAGLGAGMVALSIAIKQLSPALTLLAGGIKAVGASMAWLAANPVVLIAGGLVAAGVAVSMLIDKFRDADQATKIHNQSMMTYGATVKGNLVHPVEQCTTAHNAAAVSIEHFTKKTDELSTALVNLIRDQNGVVVGTGSLEDGFKALDSAIKTTLSNSKTKIQDTYNASITAIDKELAKAQAAHDKKIAFLDKELEKKLRQIDLDLKSATGPLTDEIKKNQAELAKMAGEDYESQKKAARDSIQEQMDAINKKTERSAEDYAELERLNKEYNALIASQNREDQRRSIEDNITTLQAKIGDLQDEAQTQRETETEKTRVAKEALDDQLADLTTQLSDRKVALDTGYQEDITRINNSEIAYTRAEQDKTAALIVELTKRKELQDYYNSIMQSTVALGPVSTQPVGGHEVTDIGAIIQSQPVVIAPEPSRSGRTGGHEVFEFAEGFIADQPTRLDNSLVGEAGPEALLPLSRLKTGGDFHLHLDGPVYMDDEANVQKLVDKIIPYLSRDNRINFGEAS